MEDPAWEVRAQALYELITLGLGKAPNGRNDLFKSALAQLYASAPESGDRLTVAIGRLAERENELSRRPHGEDFANYYGDVIAALYSAVQYSPIRGYWTR